MFVYVLMCADLTWGSCETNQSHLSSYLELGPPLSFQDRQNPIAQDSTLYRISNRAVTYHQLNRGSQGVVIAVAKGLKEAAHLNGKVGIIKGVFEDKDLYLVDFEGGIGQKLLELQNLDLPWSLT